MHHNESDSDLVTAMQLPCFSAKEEKMAAARLKGKVVNLTQVFPISLPFPCLVHPRLHSFLFVLSFICFTAINVSAISCHVFSPRPGILSDSDSPGR